MLFGTRELLSIGIILFGLFCYVLVKLIYWKYLSAKHNVLKDFDEKRFGEEKAIRLHKIRYKNKI